MFRRASNLIFQQGSLPLSGRPEEWTKWTTKSRGGVRAYDKIPAIDDPADIGIAIVNWWASMQPPFRASDQHLPLPIYSDGDADGDPWAALRKSGPNGLISLIMLMAWWGNAASVQQSEWQENSLPLWESLLADIDRVLGEMIKTSSQPSSTRLGKHAREKENTSTSGPSKRLACVYFECVILN